LACQKNSEQQDAEAAFYQILRFNYYQATGLGA